MGRVKSRANHTGTAYRVGKRWRGEARGKGYRATKMFDTKREALLWAERYEPLPKASPKLHFLFQCWSNNHFLTISKHRADAYARVWGKLELLHNKSVEEVTFYELQECVSALGSPYPERDAKTVLCAIYDEAIKNGFASANLGAQLTITQPGKPQKDAFTDEELEILWKNICAEFVPVILIMCYTGMRPVEMRLFNPELHLDVKRQHILGCGAKTELGADAPILYPQFLEPLLLNHKPLDCSKAVFYARYTETLQLLSIRYLPPGCCRHTCASLLTRAGVQPAFIKRIMRHTSYKTTLGYTHLQHTDESTAINSLTGPSER